MKTIIIASGGLDSTVLAYKVSQEQELTGVVSFDYGQRHKKELVFAKTTAERLSAEFSLVDISHVGGLLSGSALTDDVDVPDGHYEEESMKVTVVPNRNAIMLTIGYGIAVVRGADAVGTAVHGGDHFIYPDCRPDFIQSFEAMQKHALAGVAEINLYAPFVDISKAKIVKEGAALGVDFTETWSCYKGGDIHCGRCGTCVERREAFELAGVEDPTVYKDAEFWKEACNV